MIMQSIINFDELFLVNKRNHPFHLKKKCFYHKDKLVNVRTIYDIALSCSTSTFLCIKQVISSFPISMHGSCSKYTYLTPPYK